jgi:RNA polymerase sigma-70 factor (ECF subfamily)
MPAPLLDEARAAWPQVVVPEAEFLAYVDERDAGATRHRADLYLACACARRDAAALRAFETLLTSSVPSALRKQRAPEDHIDEVTQIVREKLLVGRNGAPPQIAEYAGRGPLGAWLRVIAVREHLNLVQHEGRRPRPTATGDLPDLLAPIGVETAVQRRQRSTAFRAALGAALTALDARDRALLRQHHLEGLTIDQVGTYLGVSRATAARRLAAARAALLDDTRRRLREALGADTTEIDSVLQRVDSNLDASVRTLLERTS